MLFLETSEFFVAAVEKKHAVGMRPIHSLVAYLKAGKPRTCLPYQPFRRTYGTAAWLATPI